MGPAVLLALAAIAGTPEDAETTCEEWKRLTPQMRDDLLVGLSDATHRSAANSGKSNKRIKHTRLAVTHLCTGLKSPARVRVHDTLRVLAAVTKGTSDEVAAQWLMAVQADPSARDAAPVRGSGAREPLPVDIGVGRFLAQLTKKPELIRPGSKSGCKKADDCAGVGACIYGACVSRPVPPRSIGCRSDEKRRGTVTIDSAPPAVLYLDGKEFGTTPIRRTKIAVGCHIVRAVYPSVGRELRVKISIEPNRVSRYRIDLPGYRNVLPPPPLLPRPKTKTSTRARELARQVLKCARRLKERTGDSRVLVALTVVMGDETELALLHAQCQSRLGDR